MLGAGTRTAIGTTVILHIADDAKEMLEESTIRMLVQRYCAFIRHPIVLAGDTVSGDEGPAGAPAAAEILNDPTPAVDQEPGRAQGARRLDVLRQALPCRSRPEPLLWIHLNVDYPFKLKGILYFPRFRTDWAKSAAR